LAARLAPVADEADFRYVSDMRKELTAEQVAVAKGRRLVAGHLQAIEGNPPTDEQTVMFEMFEREGWSHERRLAYIKARAKAAATVHAAE
jgi:hypothetical protein